MPGAGDHEDKVRRIYGAMELARWLAANRLSVVAVAISKPNNVASTTSCGTATIAD
jgi:hypothetical protein